MTNLEAKEKLYNEWQKLLDCNIDYAGISEAYKMAFKALGQEPVLDKIRAEIMSLTNGDTPERIWNVDVLEILDKYKAEVRNKNV